MLISIVEGAKPGSSILREGDGIEIGIMSNLNQRCLLGDGYWCRRRNLFCRRGSLNAVTANAKMNGPEFLLSKTYAMTAGRHLVELTYWYGWWRSLACS